MEYWLLQYLNFVEVLTPLSLRKRICENSENSIKNIHKRKSKGPQNFAVLFCAKILVHRFWRIAKRMIGETAFGKMP